MNLLQPIHVNVEPIELTAAFVEPHSLVRKYYKNLDQQEFIVFLYHIFPVECDLRIDSILYSKDWGEISVVSLPNMFLRALEYLRHSSYYCIELPEGTDELVFTKIGDSVTFSTDIVREKCTIKFNILQEFSKKLSNIVISRLVSSYPEILKNKDFKRWYPDKVALVRR